jgi:predicted O-methyltransferase YrrM
MRDLRSLIKKGVGGGCSNSRCNAIKDAVISTNARICVEIGVFRGSSLMCFAEALEDTRGHVFGIDPYEIDALKNQVPDKKMHDYIYNTLFTEQKVLDDMRSELIETIKVNNLEKTVSLIREKSKDAYPSMEELLIDVLHIDGNHDYKYVSQDIILYLPLVRKGGYIIMDDTKWAGVDKAIKKHMQATLVKDGGSFKVFQK